MSSSDKVRPLRSFNHKDIFTPNRLDMAEITMMRMAVHPTQDTVTGIYSRSNSRCCITTRNLIYWQLINIIENLLEA